MTNEELDQIVADLRDEAATAAANEGDYYADQFTYHGCGDAADAIEWLRAEIARLRGDAEIARLRLEAAQGEIARLRLTDEERKALKTVIGGFGMWVAENGLTDDESLRLSVVTLRKLLERLGGEK